MPTNPPEPPFDPYNPRIDPEDPGYDPRNDPRYDPRNGPRSDPRYAPRSGADPRNDPGYDPRSDPRYDPRDDPRFDRAGDGRRPDGIGYDRRQDDPRYDRRSAGDQRYAPGPEPLSRQPREGGGTPLAASAARRRLPWWAILAGLIALIAVVLFAFSLTRSNPDQDRLGDSASNSAAADPEAAAAERCGSQPTYDLMKRELFRRAGQVRGSDAGVFDRLGSYATIRVQNPVVKRQDEDVGTLVCSGQVALDLPPGLGVVGGRRTLSAAVDYSVTKAADGSGNVVTLEGADPIVVPLATLTRTDAAVAPPASAPADTSGTEVVGQAPTPAPIAVSPAPPAPEQPAAPRAPAPRQPAEPAEPRATASARPSFNCAYARTRGEVAVCGDPGLASLDRQMAGTYVSALRGASPQQRALLQRTRDRFLGFRDRCGSDACIAGAYRDRIREIGDIANDRWNP